MTRPRAAAVAGAGAAQSWLTLPAPPPWSA